MIAGLRGMVDALAEDHAVIDVGGVGYLVFGSARTLGRLAIGEAARLLVETQVREDHIHLFAFLDAAERDAFRILITVQGVGAKVALALLSALSPDQLAQAIAAQDKAALSRANGVGPKLAARLVTELKDKLGGVALGPVATLGRTAERAAPNAVAEATSALVNLGFGRSDALAAVSRAAGSLGDKAEVGALVRAGLAELGR